MKIIWLTICFLLAGYGKKGIENDSPYGTMVEFIRDAEAARIIDPEPEFSWIVPDKAEYQTAFRIIVSSSREKIKEDSGDLWDSGKTTGSQSTEVQYGGSGLKNNSTYYWKVRIWNKKGNPSGWSEIKAFRTGILGDYGTAVNRFIETLISPERIIKSGENIFFADFGKDAFGTLVLEITPKVRETLIIHLGEKLSDNNKIDRNPGGTIRYQKVALTLEPGINRYTLNLVRDERNTGPAAVHLPDSIGIIMPFRYCEIENCNLDLKPGNLFRKTYWYYFDDTESHFDSSDTILNRIWEICKYSMKATSFAGIYVDGDRERIPYEADAYINQLGHYSTDREYSIARRTNEYFISHPTWPTEWILQTVPMFYNDLMYTGNYESIKRFYKELQYKTLISIARQDGLISSKNVTGETMLNIGFANAKDRIRDIIDWPPSQKDTGWKLATPEGERDGYEMVDVNTVVNAFHYHNLVLMTRIAGYMGKSIDSLLFSEQAEKVKSAFNKVFLDKNKGYYNDGESSAHSSLHANMMALAFNLVPPEYRKSVVEFIKSRGMACSVYGAQYLLEGLYKAGISDYALGLMTSTNDRSWWNMIRSGSTITMEAWDMKYKPNSDWNHAWGAVPANIIPCYLWGISPVKPGFAKAVIKPQPGKLTYSKISFPTIRGNIKADFNRTGNRKEFLINIPGNMECDFIPDSVNDLTIILNGRKQKTGSGILKLKPGNNKIVIDP